MKNAHGIVSLPLVALMQVAFLLPAGVAAQERRRVIVGGPEDAPADWPQPQIREGLTRDEIVSSIAGYVEELAAADRFSGVVLVANAGETLLARAWGMANEHEKNTLDTKFNIGSINKVLTRKAIEQLADAGRLDLDDTLREHLPDYPAPAADRITLRQLLEQRSGLGDFFGPKYVGAPPSSLRELSDFLPLFVDEPLRFEPGTSQRYSNAGYVVLGLVVERVSGQRYRDYVRDQIFAPAGMQNSGFWARDEEVARRATGYTLRGPVGPLPKRVPNDDTLPGRPSSAGGAYTTVGDLLRLFRWLGETEIGVGGGAPGLNAVVEIEGGWTVIALSNYDPPSAEALGRGAMALTGARREEAENGPPTAPERTELSGAVAVPVAPMGHLLAVEARVEGRGPYRFVVDSGAAGLMRVSPELAEALGLEEIGKALSGDPSGANVVEVPVVRIESVEIGGARFGGVVASVGGRLDSLAADGVVGLGLFSGLTMTLDYRRLELRLSRQPLPAGDAHVVAFTSARGVPEIEIQAGGVILRADVDTGSPALLSVPPTAGLPLRGELRVVGRGRTSTNEFEIRAAELDGELRVAGWTVPNPTIDVVDLFPVANIGARFLREYAVTFDLAHGRIALAKETEGPAAPPRRADVGAGP